MFKLLVALVILSSAVGRAHIFGTDDRTRAIVTDDTPLDAVGKVNGCTATLIAEDLALTNKHCVLDMKTNDFLPVSEARDFTFKPSGGLGFSELDTTPITFIHWQGSKALGPKDVDADWAILELKDPVGKRYGWMKIAEKHANEDPTIPFWEHVEQMQKRIQYKRFEKKLLMASFPIDKDNGEILQVQRGCSFHVGPRPTLETKAIWKFILHDCDVAPGASGAPIFLIEKDKETGKEVGVIYAMSTLSWTYQGDDVQAQKSDNQPLPDNQHFAEWSLENSNGAASTPIFKRRLDILLKDRDLARRTRTLRDPLGRSFDQVTPPPAEKP